MKKLPPKKDRLPPAQLGMLFGFLPDDYEDPAHPGVPLSPEGRRKVLQSMSAQEMRKSRDQVYARDSVRYEKATGCGMNERVPFDKRGAVLMTGTRWPKEAIARLRAVLAFGVILPVEPRVPQLDKLITHRPAEALTQIKALILSEPSSHRRRRFTERQINKRIDWWRFRGFSCAELVAWAAIVSEGQRAKTAAARRKNLAKAQKKRLTHDVRRRAH
jgi:hypothetical protein